MEGKEEEGAHASVELIGEGRFKDRMTYRFLDRKVGRASVLEADLERGTPLGETCTLRVVPGWQCGSVHFQVSSENGDMCYGSRGSGGGRGYALRATSRQAVKASADILARVAAGEREEASVDLDAGDDTILPKSGQETSRNHKPRTHGQCVRALHTPQQPAMACSLLMKKGERHTHTGNTHRAHLIKFGHHGIAICVVLEEGLLEENGAAHVVPQAFGGEEKPTPCLAIRFGVLQTDGFQTAADSLGRL